MARPALRLALSLVVGLFAGSVLGVLFVPDPTSVPAFALAVACTTVITAFLYRTDWVRE